jgi:hypothetical protein
MKELVFLYMHFNGIAARGIALFEVKRNEEKTWPHMHLAWLRYKSEVSLKKTVTAIMAFSLRKSSNTSTVETASQAAAATTPASAQEYQEEEQAVAQQQSSSYSSWYDYSHDADGQPCYFGG